MVAMEKEAHISIFYLLAKMHSVTILCSDFAL